MMIVQSILIFMITTMTFLVTLTFVNDVAAYEQVDPNDQLSIQLAQLKTLEYLADLQSNISNQQLEILKHVSRPKPTSDWITVMFALPLYFLSSFLVTQVLRTILYQIKMRSDSMAETILLVVNARNLWTNRTQFHTLQEYRDSLNPPILYSICSCCKRQQARNDEEYSLS